MIPKIIVLNLVVLLCDISATIAFQATTLVQLRSSQDQETHPEVRLPVIFVYIDSQFEDVK